MKRYEAYELFNMAAMLGAVLVLGVALKVPDFSGALPVALLPVTVCAGIAAHLHRKLPKNQKCPPWSRNHPAPFFLVLLIGNAVAFLELFLKRR